MKKYLLMSMLIFASSANARKFTFPRWSINEVKIEIPEVPGAEDYGVRLVRPDRDAEIFTFRSKNPRVIANVACGRWEVSYRHYIDGLPTEWERGESITVPLRKPRRNKREIIQVPGGQATALYSWEKFGPSTKYIISIKGEGKDIRQEVTNNQFLLEYKHESEDVWDVVAFDQVCEAAPKDFLAVWVNQGLRFAHEPRMVALSWQPFARRFVVSNDVLDADPSGQFWGGVGLHFNWLFKRALRFFANFSYGSTRINDEGPTQSNLEIESQVAQAGLGYSLLIGSWDFEPLLGASYHRFGSIRLDENLIPEVDDIESATLLYGLELSKRVRDVVYKLGITNEYSFDPDLENFYNLRVRPAIMKMYSNIIVELFYAYGRLSFEVVDGPRLTTHVLDDHQGGLTLGLRL